MLEIDQQVARMLELVVERKLKSNKLKKQICLDNEDDEDKRNGEDVLINQTHKLETEYCCIE